VRGNGFGLVIRPCRHRRRIGSARRIQAVQRAVALPHAPARVGRELLAVTRLPRPRVPIIRVISHFCFSLLVRAAYQARNDDDQFFRLDGFRDMRLKSRRERAYAVSGAPKGGEGDGGGATAAFGG
jgi:hypothetical protein